MHPTFPQGSQVLLGRRVLVALGTTAATSEVTISTAELERQNMKLIRTEQRELKPARDKVTLLFEVDLMDMLNHADDEERQLVLLFRAAIQTVRPQ